MVRDDFPSNVSQNSAQLKNTCCRQRNADDPKLFLRDVIFLRPPSREYTVEKIILGSSNSLAAIHRAGYMFCCYRDARIEPYLWEALDCSRRPTLSASRSIHWWPPASYCTRCFILLRFSLINNNNIGACEHGTPSYVDCMEAAGAYYASKVEKQQDTGRSFFIKDKQTTQIDQARQGMAANTRWSIPFRLPLTGGFYPWIRGAGDLQHRFLHRHCVTMDHPCFCFRTRDESLLHTCSKRSEGLSPCDLPLGRYAFGSRDPNWNTHEGFGGLHGVVEGGLLEEGIPPIAALMPVIPHLVHTITPPKTSI